MCIAVSAHMYVHVCFGCVTIDTAAPYIFLPKQPGAPDCYPSLSAAAQCVCVSDLLMNQPPIATPPSCCTHKHTRAQAYMCTTYKTYSMYQHNDTHKHSVKMMCG